MKSIIFPSKGRIEFKNESMPKCPSNGLLLKTLFSGLSNGTERNILLDQNYGKVFPTKAGYQLVSEVIRCGKDISGYSLGDVVYNGKCKGHIEYSTVEDGDIFTKLPKKMNLESAALLGLAAVSQYSVRRVNVSESDNIAVLGMGLIGQFVSQICNNHGAKVTAIDLDESRLALAKKSGIDNIVMTDISKTNRSLKSNSPYSLVAECSGADILDSIIGTSEQNGIIDYRGRILIVAGRDKVKYDFNTAQRKEVTLVHTNHFDKLDLENTIQDVQTGKIKIRHLIKDVVSIKEAPLIYKILKDNPLELLGTVFRW